MKYYLQVLRKYATFTGRASRQEFWMFILFNFIFSIVLSLVDQLLGTQYTYYTASGLPAHVGYIDSVYGLILFLPGLAVQVRRLHDVNKSGKLILLVFIPSIVIGWALFAGALALMALCCFILLGLVIWFIVLFCTAGTTGANKYGEDPLGGEAFKFSFEEGGDLKEE